MSTDAQYLQNFFIVQFIDKFGHKIDSIEPFVFSLYFCWYIIRSLIIVDKLDWLILVC